MALADDGEIFGRDAKLLRKIFYRLMLDFALLQHLQELINTGNGILKFDTQSYQYAETPAMKAFADEAKRKQLNLYNPPAKFRNW